MIHKILYSQEDMSALCSISMNEDGTDFIRMIPGKLREQNVAVGKHKAPLHNELLTMFNTYENFYNKDLTQALTK